MHSERHFVQLGIRIAPKIFPTKYIQILET